VQKLCTKQHVNSNSPVKQRLGCLPSSVISSRVSLLRFGFTSAKKAERRSCFCLDFFVCWL